jgi:hypothetical protein
VSDQHVGVRRRTPRIPLGRVLALAAGLAVVAWALALGDPARPHPDGVSVPISVAPTWTARPTVDIAGVLADGADYVPRLYLTPDTSAGIATSADGGVRVVLTRAGGSVTQLRNHPAGDHAQVNGFAVDGDTLVWMETVTRAGYQSATSLWRTTWTSNAAAVQVTSSTGDVTFAGFSTDVSIGGGSVRWTADDANNPQATQLWSVPVGGGGSGYQTIDGEYRLSTSPWLVSANSGPGSPVRLYNPDTGATVPVTTGPGDAAVCDPTWCRVTVSDAAGLVGIDMMHPDGSARQRIASSQSTPTVADPALLSRYVPLATDRPDGVGLELYDLTSGHTQLLAMHAGNVAGRGGVLWWSTGLGTALTWHALDLATLP